MRTFSLGVYRNVFCTGYGQSGILSDCGSGDRSKAVCERDYIKVGEIRRKREKIHDNMSVFFVDNDLISAIQSKTVYHI